VAGAILDGGAAVAGAWRPLRVRAGPWRRRQPRGRLDAALELPHGRIRAGRSVLSLPAGASLPGRERRAAPALLRPASPPPWRRGLELGLRAASSSAGPRATAMSSRRRHTGLGVWPPFLSLLSLSLYLSPAAFGSGSGEPRACAARSRRGVASVSCGEERAAGRMGSASRRPLVAGWTGTIFFYDVATLSCLLLVRKS